MRGGELTEAAGCIVDAYSIARPQIYLSVWEASALQAMPPGPTDLESVRRGLESMGFSANLIDSLEAMRLASVGAPDVREPVPTFTLTGARRLGYYGRTGVTDPGRALLRLVDLLESRRESAGEVREEEMRFHA